MSLPSNPVATGPVGGGRGAPPMGPARFPKPAVPPAVAVTALCKTYGGVVALDSANLSVRSGRIHAVVGENGAGKSTLMKILAGAVPSDSGTIELDGESTVPGSPGAARARGVGIVYQELSLFPNRSVLANLFVNAEPTRYGLLARREMARRASGVLQRVGLRIELDRPVGMYSIGIRQLVELCRVLLEGPRLLILDEPNSALSERESERLFSVLRELSADGVTMLYVSHRLEEVFAVCDDVTVMRNGRDVLTRERQELTMSEVVSAMIGGSERALYPERQAPGQAAPPAMAIRALSVGDELRDVSFQASAGEIVGLAGLEGSGVAALLGALFGLRRTAVSNASFPDGGGLPTSPTAAARRGISLVPADRRHQGLMLHRSVARNIVHVRFGALRTRDPWLRRTEMEAAARRQIDDLRIKARAVTSSVNQLSGGNQQKVVIGKWLEVRPDVVLLDDPTRGVDIGAKREIYHLIRQLADEGRVVIFRSTELPELVGLADRILVLYRQRLVGEVRGSEIDDRGLLHMINTGELPQPIRRDGP